MEFTKATSLHVKLARENWHRAMKTELAMNRDQAKLIDNLLVTISEYLDAIQKPPSSQNYEASINNKKIYGHAWVTEELPGLMGWKGVAEFSIKDKEIFQNLFYSQEEGHYVGMINMNSILVEGQGKILITSIEFGTKNSFQFQGTSKFESEASE